MTCLLGLKFRDAVTCSEIRSDGTCHNHEVVAGLRKHAVDADRFELENKRLRAALEQAKHVLDCIAINGSGDYLIPLATDAIARMHDLGE